MRNSTKLFGSIAIAGLVAAGGSAFTGTGLDRTAPDAQFVGGTVTQTVTGATLSDISYGDFADAPANTQARNVTLTFDAEALVKDVSIVLNGGVGNIATSCGAVQAVTFTSTCTFAASSVSSIAVTVANPA